MTTDPAPALGARLDPELRRDVEEVSRSVPVDEGGGASLLKVLVLADLIVTHELTRVVEIGVYRGRLLLPLARLMARLGRGEVVGIDPYSSDAAVQRDVEHEGIDLVEWPNSVDWSGLHREVVDAISRWGLEERTRLVRKRSEDAAGAFASSPIDMLHIDGNHDRAAVTRDVERFLPYVKDGGFLVMDDITWPSVRPVYEALLDEHELVFALAENGVKLWPADMPNDFAVLRVRKASPEASLADFASSYQLPLRDPGQVRPTLVTSGPLGKRAARARDFVRRKARGRRLAYLDSTFPWERSGFRYHEAQSLLALRPDTLFFSLWDLTDPFPAPVQPLSEFPRIALREGITDTYGVFSLFLESLCGMRPSGSAHPMEGLDISAVAEETGIRMHGTIFPGGGFTPTPEGFERARELASRLHTTFSYVPEVLENVPGVTPIDQALTEVRFYPQTVERWEAQRPLVCMFAGDAAARKGVDVALSAVGGLDPGDVHLHVVGPHEHRRDEYPEDLVTFHGWLSPAQLRNLHRRVHVFLSPVSAEPADAPGSYRGVTDGFPTQAAADAMSGGVLLVSANPGHDHRVLSPGAHYVECAARPGAVREAVVGLIGNLDEARRIAQAGSDRVRERMDVRDGIALKLNAMELGTRA